MDTVLLYRSEKGAVKGAVLTMVAFASAVALLSAAILFGYISSVTEHQEVREEQAQAYLTQISAIERYVNMHRCNELNPGESPSPLLLGGFETEISIIENSITSEIKISYLLPGLADVSVVGSISGMVVAGIKDNALFGCLFVSGDADIYPKFPVEICETPKVWRVYGNTSNAFEAVFICRFETRDSLFLIDHDGNLLRSCIPNGIWTEDAVVIAGVVADEKAVIIAGTTEIGCIVYPESDRILTITSPAGTCPVITPDGNLYGEVIDDAPDSNFNSNPILLDYFTGDFNKDGMTDLAWIHVGGITCYITGRDVLHYDRSDGSELRAWGFLEGRHGLGGLWRHDNGLYSWRKFYQNGFAQLPASSFLLEDFSGRIFGGGNVYFSAITDSTVLLSENDRQREFPGMIGDYDLSGRADVAFAHDEHLDIWADPGVRNARMIRVEAKTGIPGLEPILTGEYEFYVYPATGNTNIVMSGGNSF